MSTLLAMRAAIVSELATAFGAAVRSVESHGGRFDSIEELRRMGAAAPCILVGCIDVPNETRQSGQTRAMLQFGAFVVTRGDAQHARDEQALGIAGGLLAFIPGRRFGITDAGPAEGVKGRNMYSGKVDNTGVALWAITWQQPLDLDIFDAASLVPFESIYIDYDIAPADGNIDAQDIIEPEQ